MPHHIQPTTEGIARVPTRSSTCPFARPMNRVGIEWARHLAKLRHSRKRFIYTNRAVLISVDKLQVTPSALFIQQKVDALFPNASGLTVKEIYSKTRQYLDGEEGQAFAKVCRNFNIATMDMTYRYRMFALFQRQEGTNVLILCMSVKEYPVQGYVTIDYLDSVNLFKQYDSPVNKTQVYREIILSYFEYAQSLGYRRAHIYVCALDKEFEYFFHQRPDDMMLPDQKALWNWYWRCLEKGSEKGIIKSFGIDQPIAGTRRTKIEEFIMLNSFSEFHRNVMLDILKERKTGNGQTPQFFKDFKNGMADYDKKRSLLFIELSDAKPTNAAAEEVTIDREWLSTRTKWHDVMEKKQLKFSSHEEAKTSTCTIVKMLMSDSQ